MSKNETHQLTNSKLIDKLEEEALGQLKSIKSNVPRHLEEAKSLIQINANRIRNYLDEIKKEGYKIGPNFKKNEKEWDNDNEFPMNYRFSIKRIEIHLEILTNTVKVFRKGGYIEMLRLGYNT